MTIDINMDQLSDSSGQGKDQDPQRLATALLSELLAVKQTGAIGRE